MIAQLSTPEPLISVVIATRNRATMLQDSIHSVLCQTYSSLEVIVVDDGSHDDTQQVVENIGDARIRYVRQDHAGISAARNLGTRHARGEWLAVHDDDDIMLPTRLADQLEHVDDDVDFVYGAFINFDDETAELQLHHGRNYGYGAALMSGFAPGHSTWLVRMDIMRQFPYDEGIESAVDNNLVFRMLRSGVRFRHSGVICLLRRVHSGRITDTGGSKQKYVAGLNHAFLSRGIDPASVDALVKAARRDWGPVDKDRWQTRFLPYLPDHLVVRSGYVSRLDSPPAEPESESALLRLETIDVSALDWRAFLELCAQGGEVRSVRARLRETEEIENVIAEQDISARLERPDPLQDALGVLLTQVSDSGDLDYFAIVTSPVETWSERQKGLTSAQCEVSLSGSRVLVGLIPLKSWRGAASLRESAFPGATSFRIFSTKASALVADELDAAL